MVDHVMDERETSIVKSQLLFDSSPGSLLAPGVEEELILKNKDDSLAQFQHMCTRTPAHVLRSAVEIRSSCFQDFITKKRRFEESLAVMTFVSSLLGLKDRHLENVLYRRGDGTVRCIDWNPVLQHGARELPPARLTRSLLALCRLPVLESRLQQMTTSCRKSYPLLQSSLRVSFKWIGEDVEDKLEDVEDLMRGSVLSHQVTERSRLRNPGRYTHKYVEMLEEIFQDFDTKDTYSVEEQVTDLLRHSTDPYILSVTRPAWMPWI
ncbi:uncharacterized protein [Battus philenor]|uniref:uncharacterized protein n=1 Tax=Battus philenor TaxID=42288 RepID=UPI0035CE93CB